MINLSLLCVARNESLYLRQSIESVINQVKEVIFIDHYSIDRTGKIAEELAAKYENFRIIPIEKNINYAEVRNLLISHVTSSYWFKYDADIMFTDDAFSIIQELIDRMNVHKEYTCAILSYVNLFYDTRYSSKGSHEPYLCKNGYYKYIVKEYSDTLVPTNKNLDKRIDDRRVVFVHANNIKPIFNLLFRGYMTVYKTSDDRIGYNYFEWLYRFKNNNKVSKDKKPSKDELCGFILKMIRHIINSTTVKDNQIVTKNDRWINYFNNSDFVADINAAKVTFKSYHIIKYNDMIVKLSDPDWEKKLINILNVMHDDNIFDNFN